jgi:hypothetical protein
LANGGILQKAVDLVLPYAGLADPYVARHVGDGAREGGRDAFDATTVRWGGIAAFSDWAVSDSALAALFHGYLSLILK